MVVGANDVFEKISDYVRKQYSDIEELSMPYCSLAEDKEERYYRVQISFRRKFDIFYRSAIAKADPTTGDITMYKEGFTWRFWLG